MKFELWKASEDCYKQVTGSCIHYPSFYLFIIVYFIFVALILYYRIKNSNVHSSMIAILLTTLFFPITYPIKFLFDISGN